MGQFSTGLHSGNFLNKFYAVVVFLLLGVYDPAK